MRNYMRIITVTLVLILVGVTSCSRPNQESVGFGIFLLENDELVLSDKHIKAYDKNTHEIELNEDGVQKWNSYVLYDESFDPPIPKLGGKLYTKDFVVKIRGKEIYQGKFLSYFSSTSYEGVVILDTLGSSNGKISIDFGYPVSSNNDKEDPRNNVEIMDYLKKQALLK